MRKHSAPPIVLAGILAACMSLPALTGLAQTQPAAPPTTTSAPAASEAAPPSQPTVAPAKPPKGAVKPGQPTQPGATANRKYERSYKHCKVRALRRGLKGTERRAFIRRCELGFAPPRTQIAPGTQPAPAPVPDLLGTFPATPAPSSGTPPARK